MRALKRCGATRWSEAPMAVEKIVRNGRVRFRSRYYDPSGRRTSKTFDREADAKRFDTAISHSKDIGNYVAPDRSRITVGPFADLWIESKLDLAPKTRDRYEGIIRAHIKPRWGNVPLSKVRHADLQRWIAGIDAAPATVKKIHRVMSMLLAWAVADDRLAKNPAEKIQPASGTSG
jgi:Phage integrase, N-terminal SAM-like domain